MTATAFDALYLTNTDCLAANAYTVRRRHALGEALCPVLGYIRTGMRAGVECYLWSDTNAAPHSRSAWQVIGPLDAFSGLAAAALTMVEPAPVTVARAPGSEPIAAEPAAPAYHPQTVRALRIYQAAAKARCTRIPDADAADDYASAAEFHRSEPGIREPVASIRNSTRRR